MALQLKDRVRTACSTVGTGNIIVGSNRAGYQNWDAITNGNTVYYCIIEGNAWEVGHGVKTDGVITRNVIASSTGSLIDLKGTEDVFETYPAEKAVILDVDGNLTVDGDVFADNLYTKTQTDTLLDNKANVGDSYTKAETYSNVEVDSKLFEKADKTDTYTKAEVDSTQSSQDTEIAKKANQSTTYTKSEVDATQDAQDTIITSNTTAIGTLSGKVATNTADIATLQEGIFFSSSYTTDYPVSVNRDPGTGNIYLQKLSAFTYSYADANQVFISKTDEQGNVRQFTAVNPDDILVLNQVESPNYGRYKVSTVNDMGTYVNIIMEFQTGEGTVLEGDTLALQAFPASAGGSGGGIPEAPIDGKQYGRQDATWTEVTGGEAPSPVTFRSGSINPGQTPPTNTDYKIQFGTPETHEGGTFGGTYFTPETAGWYQVSGSVFINAPTTSRVGCLIQKNGSSQLGSFNQGITAVGGGGVSTSGLVYCNGTTDKLSLAIVCSEAVGEIGGATNTTWFSAHLVTGGSSSGGGSYTPEPLVWENVTADRVTDATYTNNYDVPLYVQIDTTKGASGANFAFEIDGNRMGKIGTEDSQSSLFIVPAKATYKLIKMVADGTIENWNEAKMPLAIGTGGGGTGTTTATVDTAIGMVAPFAMDSVPTGWLHCDGSAVSRTTYSLLYSKIGDTYGVGDGSTTFNLPDLQDEFIRGSSDTLPVGNKQDDEFKAHTHLVGGSASKVATNSNQAKFPGSATIDSSSTGGEETRPRNVAMLYCINATAESSSGGGEAQPPVAFNTLLTSAQTISPATKTTILYDDVKLDTDSNYNSTTGKYTISSDGIYRIGASVNLKKNNVLIDALAYLNINSEAPQRNRFDYDASTGTSSSFMAVNIDYVADLKQGDEVSISAYGRTTDDSDLELIGGIDAGNVFNIIKVSGGASSGGGTAEPMVWENKKAERAYDTVYTNTKDCPIYVQPYLERNSTERMYVQFKIDGDLIFTEGGESISFDSPMFVVPSGSTYELVDQVAGTALVEWFEANVSGGSSSGGGSGTPSSFARIVDEKPEGTQAGDAVAGNNIRDLNTVVYDKDNIVTVAGNAFTLQEGTYVIDYSAPTHMVNSHKVSLRNITDGESVSQGSSEYSANASNSPASVGDNRSFGKYVVTLTKPTTYQLNHYAQIAKTGNGLGISTVSQGAPNVYATVDIQKVGTGGASSGGGTTDILPVLYSGSISSVGVVNYGTGFTSAKITTGTYKITFDTPLANNEYVVNSLIRTSGDRIVSIIDQTETYFTLTTKTASTLTDCNFAFTVTGIETIAVGGGSGGGSGWKETVLFENEAGAINFALSESYDSFDYLRFDTIRTDAGVKKLNRSDMIPVASCSDLVLDNYSSTHMYYSCEDKINFTCTSNTSVAMFRVVGINTGSGSSSGGDSIWSDVDGDAVLETDGKKLTLDANVAELGAKARITTDTNSLEFNVGSGGLPDMVVNDGFVKLQRDGQEINLNPAYGGAGGNAVIESNDPVSLVSNSKYGITVDTDGHVTLPNTRPGSGAPANMNMDPEGRIYRLTDVRSIDEVEEAMDKKLAIKDKLIEKLSARLDKLEKKVK